MKRFNVPSGLLAAAAVAGWLFAAPASAAPRQGGGRPTSSRPPSGGGGGSAAPAPRGGGSDGGGSNGGGQTAVPRATPRDSGAGSGAANGSGSNGTASRPTSNRGAGSGTVVGRATAPVNGGGGTAVIVPNGYYGGFYPWGYAGLGFGGYYGGYYGYYDPWLYDDPYFDAPVYAPDGHADSEMRLKVKPRDAKVYVDGAFAGTVDDFDGVFQRLHLVPGRHHIEIRADGYAPLEFDVDARRNRTVTYEEDMKQQ